MTSPVQSTTQPVRRLGYRPDIDGLRALAVGAVVLFHLGLTSFSGGFIGVDIFFVISGFLITRLIRDAVVEERFSFGSFYIKRSRRLFPAMVVTVAVTLLLGVLLYAPTDLERVGGSSLSALFSVSNIFFWTEKGYFDAASALKPLLHTWSLGVEEQFYFIWPAIFVFLLTHFRQRVVIGLVLAGSLVSLGLNEVFADKGSALFFLLPFRVFEFGIGALLVWVCDTRPLANWLKEIILAVGLLLMGYALFAFDEFTKWPMTNALVPCIGAAMAIYAGQARYVGKIINNPVMVRIGQISYSLYLVHWPVVVFWPYAFGGDLIGPAEQVGLGLLMLVLAELMYRFVETPFRHPRADGVKKPLSAPAFGLVCVAFAAPLIFISASIWANQGWPWRLSPEARQVFVEAQPQPDPTTLGQTENPTFRILLVGDSHAGHYLTLLSDFALYHDTEIVNVGASCAPLPGATIVGSRGVEGYCQTYGEQIEAIAPDFDAVVLASRWANYTETRFTDRERAFLHTRRYAAWPGQTAEEFQTVENARAVFDASLTRWIESLTAQGIPVLIMGQVPEHGDDFWRCETRIRWGNSKPCTPYYTAMQSLDRLAHAQALFKSLSTRPLVTFADMAPIFCPPGEAYCRARMDGQMVYRDNNHLTHEGARLLARRIKPALDAFYSDYAAEDR
ncbi:acyltransferase family protein [Parvularcula sp. LCG005]|uniref:acyltransferase family protein n=1 Tax=Parvularcula sp. LCG005 TaxID=3078805 RepID=UPI0029429D8D|nr:acyltransferase family protein [Parvularcula sp. LCG005]WOI54088.1 acyltransferase family protein [Parvularcula sp. LCG005]